MPYSVYLLSSAMFKDQGLHTLQEAANGTFIRLEREQSVKGQSKLELQAKILYRSL